jgi:broad specificity phosphatase PhoE
MKTIEVRRHAMRDKPNKHISQAGITLARSIGANMGHFDRVISSTLPRALETAIAMGYEVHQRVELIERYSDSIEKSIPWPQPFSVYQSAYQAEGYAAIYMRELAGFYAQLAESLPDSGSALVISHGGIVEMSAVACVPEYGYSSAGSHLECCEGIRLTWNDGAFTHLEILRI